MNRFAAKILALYLVFSLLSLAPMRSLRAKADSLPAEDRGAIALGQAIKRLGTIASILHTGAHPDDEDSGLLATMARGRQARTAYLALTRGDGGQNLIGAELYEALGVIRTEELLAARRLDGATQYFTRAFDFGFSKSRDEALTKWPQEELLRDMVRVIRTFRPLVIVPVFTGTTSDGHGHHQASGYLTPIAYRDAADPRRFPEQLAEGLKPWKAKKLFLRSGDFQQPRTEPSKEPGVISINTGAYDALLGRSYYEIAIQGRSQHRSQDQGAIELKGPRYSFYQVADSSVGVNDNPQDLFDGIDISLLGIADFAGKAAAKLKPELAEVQKAADEAEQAFKPLATASLTPIIARGLKKLRQIRAALAAFGLSEVEFYDTDFLLNIKEHDFEEALAQAEGVVIDCLSDDEVVTPGQTFKVGVSVFVNGRESATAAPTTLLTPKGWLVEAQKNAQKPNENRLAGQLNFNVTVAKDEEPTQPYWLKNPRKGDMFVPGSGGTGIEPVAPPTVIAEVKMEIAGQEVTLHKAAQYRFADKALGEVRRDLKIAPAVAVNVAPNLIVVPLSTTPVEREVNVSLTNNLKSGAKGRVKLDAPKAWAVTPASVDFTLQREGERATFAFKIKAAPNATEAEKNLTAVATLEGREFKQGDQVLSYTHIEPRFLYRPSTVRALALDVKVAANLHVGWIEGAGDDFANALARLGVQVHTIDANELATGDLSRFDTIVTGIRVYEVRPDVVANNQRLLDYVKNGGTLVVQYNKNEYARGNFAPFPIKMPERGFERVTDENAVVTILAPSQPLFNAPNKITERDFAGWGQERGAYFLTEWDSHFIPLMACHDQGEADKKGGEVIAEYGRGLYVYTAYAWFRQLPNGVPGAYRLIANLVSLPKTRGVQK
ncbi:MAG: PIG-L family deacetylase [Acidobacteria bacterium]|nr:PIG-L family deacetylase [Acidobacteriota bacterium]